MLRLLFLLCLLPGAIRAADSRPLVAGDPLACFSRMDGAGTLSTVTVSDTPFTRAIDVKTGTVAANANPWDIRPRCFNTLAAAKDEVVVASFWMRTIDAPGGKGITTFVLERGNDPYTKSITYTVVAQSDWKRVEIPFTMAESYAAGGYNLSFWVTFPNQEIQIGGFTILDYGTGVPFSQLGLTAWPYEGHAADAPWRAAAAARIERLRKGDIVITVKDASGKPVAGAPVRVEMKRHAFGFGTAVAGDVIQRTDDTGNRYRAAIRQLFNKVVTENALKWPPFEGYGKAQADFMLPWFAANGITMVRGHNVIWPGSTYLPPDVQKMLQAKPVDAAALRARVNSHLAQVMAYTRGKVTEWDVLNEPYTNKDLQAVLGDSEMAEWFKQARAADPSIKLYINDYSNVESGGYDLPHINGYYDIIQKILAQGGPIDGIGLQSHFNGNLTPPDRVLEVLDQFAQLGKDLQVTEFDIDLADEQIQADYTRDFLTTCFSHSAIRGFVMWGFWEGAHWLPRGAMIRRDWSTKPNYDVWNDLVFHQWWTSASGVTGADGTYRTRGFLGDYEVQAGGTTAPLHVVSNSEAAALSLTVSIAVPVIDAARGVVNGANYRAPVAPGGLVTVFGSNLGPASGTAATANPGERLPTLVGGTRVWFDGTAAPLYYAQDQQVDAVAPSTLGATAAVTVEYQGVTSAPAQAAVATTAPALLECGARRGVAVATVGAAASTSCAADFVAPLPGSAVTFFATGMGPHSPATADGEVPSGTLPTPALPWNVSFGGVAAKACSATAAALVSPGVTRLTVCLPDDVARAADVPVIVTAGGVASAAATLDTRSSYRLLWSDEFDGAAGTAPDPKKWTYDTGAGGWGNNELETYTNSTGNVYLDGAGNLAIRAARTGANSYTSGRIKTQGLFTVTYCKIEARIKIPYGQGIWPAFWMLGADIDKAGWPACGEIDIMENIGREPGTVHGTVHGPGYSGGNGIGAPFVLSGGGRFAGDYHVYAIEWSPASVAFTVDGTRYFEVTPARLPAGTQWVYQHPFFLLLNVAVGGSWPGNPDATTVFPQTMLVDWVRVWQLQ